MIADKLASADAGETQAQIDVEYWNYDADTLENDDDYDHKEGDIAVDNVADILENEIQISTPTISTLVFNGEVMFKCETSTRLTRKTRYKFDPNECFKCHILLSHLKMIY